MAISLIKRLAKGSKVLPAEEDGNMTTIENAINGFQSQLAVALNPDGTIKNGAVSTASIQDRAVTQAKLAQDYAFYAEDNGVANAIFVVFVPVLTAYKKGTVIYVKVKVTNTGTTTMNIDSIALRPVRKFTGAGMVELSAGDLQSNGVYEFVDDGSQFILQNPTIQIAATGPTFLAGVQTVHSGGATAWKTCDVTAWVPAGAKAVILQHQIRWASATDGDGRIYMRKNNLSMALFVGRAAGIDGTATACGGQVFPVNDSGAVRSFDVQVTESVLGAVDTVEIDLIGFIT